MNRLPEDVPVRKSMNLPQDVCEWLAREAARNFSSTTAEIVRSVRQRMAQQQQAER
jgi:hypothetical protein